MKYFIDPTSGNLYMLDPAIPSDQALILQLEAKGYPETTFTIYQTKQQAKSALAETDWTEITSVSDPSNPVYLLNADEFITYRNQLRAIAVDDTGTVQWPVKPTEQWS